MATVLTETTEELESDRPLQRIFRRNTDKVERLIGEALDRVEARADNLAKIELALTMPGISRIFARRIIRLARERGVDVEKAIGDGSFLDWIVENWDSIEAVILLIVELFLALG